MSLPLSPDRILGIGFGFFSAKVLMTAVQLDVFSLLRQNPLTRAELAAALGMSQRGARDFFDALVALEILRKIPSLPTPRYAMTEESARYLDPTSEWYVGGILAMAGERLYRFWHDLPEALVTGRPQSEVKHQGKPLFDEIFQDPVKLRGFASAMAGLSRQNFAALTDKFPFGSYTKHVDVGASTALLSRMVVDKYPTVRSVAFDLPQVAQVAREHIKAGGYEHLIQVAEGSFLSDDIPSGDVITLGNILHDWDLDRKKLILSKVFQALEKGGACLIVENIIDDGREKNAFGLLMSLNMLIEFGDAYDCTFSELEALSREVGFERFERLHVHGPCSALVAYKL